MSILPRYLTTRYLNKYTFCVLYLSKICAQNKSSNLNLQLNDTQTLFKEPWTRVKLYKSQGVLKPTTRVKKRNITFIMNLL